MKSLLDRVIVRVQILDQYYTVGDRFKFGAVIYTVTNITEDRYYVGNNYDSVVRSYSIHKSPSSWNSLIVPYNGDK